MVLSRSKVFAFLIPMFFFSFAALNADAQPEGSIYHLPAGTRIWLKAETAVNSKFSSADDTFVGKVSRPVMRGDRISLHAGVRIEGRIVSAKAAKGGGRNGLLRMRFEKMMFADDSFREIDGVLVDEFDPGSSGLLNTAVVLGTSAAGSIIGGIAGSARGSLIGGGLGAGAGTGLVLMRKGKNVGIREDEEFEIELKQDVFLPVTDY